MAAADLSRFVVMVVDNHRDTLEMFEHVLRGTGAKVIVARSALRALAIIRTVVPSIIVASIEMPHLDGFSFLAAARAIPTTRDLPIIAITGVPFQRQRQDWKDAGFARVLVKPVDPFLLCEIITEVMDEMPAKHPAAAVPRIRFRFGDLVTSVSHPEWVGEITDVSGVRSGYVTVHWHTSSGTAIWSDAEPVVGLVRLPAVSGGGTASRSLDAMLSLHRSALLSSQTSRRLWQDSGRLRIHARELRERAGSVRAERRRSSVVPAA